MPGATAPSVRLAIRPANADRWPDVEALFGRNGACAGCWCQWWRLRGAAWRGGKGAKNQAAFRRQIRARGPAPGLLAYAGREPVGWLALAPRGDYLRLAHSRVLAPVDETPVWSLTCFFVRADWRGRGVARALVAAAGSFARKHGARLLEAYPVDTGGARRPGVWLYTGTAALFASAGFSEVARRSPTRPIMRLTLSGSVSCM
ncbi:MAG: GNAT family N-acetyltransferase [Verrucomicrobia bacterium]|nr:GNAT family N-acetyltransferase [Verrucomicrobiota bacterium]